MNIRNVSPTPWRAVALVGVFIAVLVAAVAPADASHPTIWDPKVHWNDASTYWHWGSALEGHHTDFKLPANAAWWLTWQDACCPDSPWHTHFDTSAGNHVDTIYFMPESTVARAGRIYDGNASFHMNWASVEFNHNLFNNNATQTDDQIYRGAGSPPANSGQVDAWSAAAEEFGHVQNLNHFGGGCNTMGSIIYPQFICKRTTSEAEREGAIRGWELSHP